ncbi:hypothetical protein [Bacteroides sp.]|uniref:hypothetical protein n=1 Tax=Bacteroides sp. TaxID=29523 RepID=UPI00261CD756|nr:hypothetical protein [Bacteroides sp.]
MKTITIYLSILMSLLLAACNTIEDRDNGGRLLTENELQFDMIQTPVGSNTVILENKTKGVIPYFDWGTGYSNKQKTEAYFPFAGEYTLTFTAYCDGGAVSTTRTFNVAQNDPAYFENPAWGLLSGNNKGKTWVFATDIPKSSYEGRIWGNGGYKRMPQGPDWWGRTAADAHEDKIDLNAEMYFDLEGAANFKVTYNGTTTNGIYDLKLDEQVKNDDGSLWSIGSLQLSSATIPHGISVNEGNKTIYKFDICILTEDELVLAYLNPTVDYGETWYWRFKRKGFNY